MPQITDPGTALHLVKAVLQSDVNNINRTCEYNNMTVDVTVYVYMSRSDTFDPL